MPIPSLSSAARSRSQSQRANSISSRSEVLLHRRSDAFTVLTSSQRLAQPTSSEHNGSTAAPNRLHKRSDSQNAQPKQTISDAALQRRSFLPQPGVPRATNAGSFSTGEAAAAQARREAAGLDRTSSSITPRQAGVGETKQARPRPRSLYQIRAVPEDATPGTNGTPYSPRTTDPNTKPPSSVGLTRTQSLRRPGVPPQPAPAPTPASRIHTRAQSTNTAISARKDITEADKTGPRAERPKSFVGAPTHTRNVNNGPVEAASGVVRTTARLDSLKRSASTRSQPNDGREALKQDPKKSARPAFSTLQQHFTPRKTGKAPTATFLQAPEPVNHVLPPEIISLQNELLQLHLLHESSALTNEQWELSAQKALQTKFDEVASLNQVMQEKERLGQEQKNILALREWNGPNALSGLVEHIQALSSPLHELPSLLDPGGRFFQLVETFTQWISRVDEVWSNRTETRAQRNLMQSLEGLGDTWRGEHAAMMRKLTAFARHLGGLPQAVPGSSIAHIVSRCQSLVDGLLSELQIMQATENDVVAREKRWVEERLRTIAQDVVDVQLEAEEEAWRMY